MPTYRLSRAAANDITAIFIDGIDRFGLVQADRYHQDMTATLDFLARYPRAARLRDEIEPPVRIHRYGSHLIVYEEVDDGILILRVRHGREDWAAYPA
jgi:toxin ParE1/3/4